MVSDLAEQASNKATTQNLHGGPCGHFIDRIMVLFSYGAF